MTMAIMGGAIIGLAVSLMLFLNGRVTGISGIVAGVTSPEKGDLAWRLLFILGLLSGGLIIKFFHPVAFQSQSLNMSLGDYIFAGILVGFGTLLGNGCTSGHGVCGISRLSLRSIVATLVFISSGIVSVLIFKVMRGEL